MAWGPALKKAPAPMFINVLQQITAAAQNRAAAPNPTLVLARMLLEEVKARWELLEVKQPAVALCWRRPKRQGLKDVFP